MKNNTQKSRKGNYLILIAFVLYIIIMIWELFMGKYRTFTSNRSYNLIPLNTIINYINNSEKYNTNTLFINLLANIIVFVPLGFLLPAIEENMRRFTKILFISFIIIIGAETLQFILNVGIFDIDDIILNLLGVIIGYFILKLLLKMNKR